PGVRLARRPVGTAQPGPGVVRALRLDRAVLVRARGFQSLDRLVALVFVLVARCIVISCHYRASLLSWGWFGAHAAGRRTGIDEDLDYRTGACVAAIVCMTQAEFANALPGSGRRADVSARNNPRHATVIPG